MNVQQLKRFLANMTQDDTWQGPITIKIYGSQDKDALALAEMASNMYCSLWDFKEYLHRKVNKGEHSFSSPEEALQIVFDKFFDILENNHVDLDIVS